MDELTRLVQETLNNQANQKYIESLLEQNGKLIYENKQLRKANSAREKENKKLKRILERKGRNDNSYKRQREKTTTF
jgi:hypothetical protein